MLFRWLKQRRRQKLLAEPFPVPWRTILEKRVTLYRFLDANEQERLHAAVRVLLAEKDWQGHRDFAITDDIRLTIAGLASFLLLGLPNSYYDTSHLIVVYPEPFRAPRAVVLAGEATLQTELEVEGDAEYHGPVRLSWADVEAEAANPGYGKNLVFHEFAHQLDMENGEADGVPVLPTHLQHRWQRTMAKEFERLCKAADRERDTFLDPYGATDEAEFFAVVTETFFDQPLELRTRHPNLYELFREYYNVEPAKWFERMLSP